MKWSTAVLARLAICILYNFLEPRNLGQIDRDQDRCDRIQNQTIYQSNLQKIEKPSYLGSQLRKNLCFATTTKRTRHLNFLKRFQRFALDFLRLECSHSDNIEKWPLSGNPSGSFNDGQVYENNFLYMIFLSNSKLVACNNTFCFMIFNPMKECH